MNQTHFIADLHLCEDTPKLNMLFLKYLADWVGRLDALYILGDLFDAWVGDDDHHHATEEIIAALRAFAQKTPVFVQHGNRDFLLGAEFARRAGVTLLDEVHSLHVYDRSFVLVHGDSLCTDDTVYQQFRSQSRHPAWQAAILAKPLAERRLLAAQIRQVSEQGKAEYGQADIYDATETGIQALMQGFSGKPTLPDLIHGHTHRPGQHVHQHQGQSFHRYVIQDWHDAQGGYLAVYADGRIQARPLPE